MHRFVPASVALALIAGVLSFGAVGADAAPAGRGASPGTFSNPLDLRLPGGGRAENCADPVVTAGAGADRSWYLYCTTDAIVAGEEDAAGSRCST